MRPRAHHGVQLSKQRELRFGRTRLDQPGPVAALGALDERRESMQHEPEPTAPGRPRVRKWYERGGVEEE